MDDKKIERAYSNQAIINISLFDMSFTFFNTRPGKEISETDMVAEIVMSPQHAKSFAINLGNYLRDYEKIFGEINLDPNQEAIDEITRQNKV